MHPKVVLFKNIHKMNCLILNKVKLYLNKLSKLCIGGVMCDEEPQAAIRDLYWGWTTHF